jgi:hypothetical protein
MKFEAAEAWVPAFAGKTVVFGRAVCGASG